MLILSPVTAKKCDLLEVPPKTYNIAIYYTLQLHQYTMQ